MDLEQIKNRIDLIISRYNRVYEPSELNVIKFKARYDQLLRELDFNLATFGVETLIHYFNSWSSKERFGKLAYYSKMIANGGDSRKEGFFLYATVDLNDAIVSFLKSIPEYQNIYSKERFNRSMFDLQRSIEHLDSITEKLEVLKKFYEQEVESKIVVPEIFKDTPIGGVAFLPKFKEEVESICFQMFPEANRLYTSLYIPDRLFQFNFEFVQDDSEYTFWFLKYNAKRHFDIYIMSDIYDDLESPLRKEHVSGYLNDLEVKEQDVKDLVSTHQIHSNKENPEFATQTETLRILEGYYELNSLNNVFSNDNITVELYAKHVFLKEYLKGQQRAAKSKISKSLEHYFATPSHYRKIMEILVKEGKCQPKTYNWIDKAPGYKNYLGYLFRDLWNKGYFLGNRQLRLNEIIEVADNTFGVELKPDTVKKTSSPPDHLFRFIPHVNDIEEEAQ